MEWSDGTPACPGGGRRVHVKVTAPTAPALYTDTDLSRASHVTQQSSTA